MQSGTAEVTISPQSALLASARTSGNSFIARLNYEIEYKHIYIYYKMHKMQNTHVLAEYILIFLQIKIAVI